MILKYNYILFLCLLLKLTIAANNHTNNTDKESRQTATCPENEVSYPGDGDKKYDLICDCRPAYIYHSPTDKCWPAFQQGPCSAGKYLFIPSDSPIPVCAFNPCVEDGYVPWNGKCERLGTKHPCKYMHPISAALGVNATTLVVSCVRLNLEDTKAPNPPVTQCPNGGRRSVRQECVPITF